MTKLVFSLSGIVVIFAGPGIWLTAIFPGLVSILFLLMAGLIRRTLWIIIRLLTPFAIILFLIHGFFSPLNQTVLLPLGSFSIGAEGLIFAATIITRLISALAASLLLVTTTHPSHLVQALYESGFPYKFAYLLSSPLLLLPQIASRVKSIQDAQQSRGLETQGNLFKRIRALIPLAAPLIFSTLVDVEERSLALEVRGFSVPGSKTNLNQLVDTRLQLFFRWAIFVFSGILVALGLWWRLNGNH